jgi:outer membrane protein OmpA-like peptidoglycan-associated protein
MRIQEINIQTLSWILVICLLPSLASGQTIKLNNGSFEAAVPTHSTTPYGWHNCGNPAESPPDIQPGHFKVTKKPANGKTYLGLVTRDNDTNEGISQRLTKPLIAGECYEFSISLAKAALYVSMSKSTMKDENFKEPIILRIYGGNTHCDKAELLAETAPITNIAWKKYDFKFNPKKGNHNYIFLEAYYKKGAFFPYNGNILIDNASSIVNCDKKEEILANLNIKVVDKKTGRSLKGAKIKVINTVTKKALSKESVGASRYAWADLDQEINFRIEGTKEGYKKATKFFNTKNLTKTKNFAYTISLEKEEIVDPIAIAEPVIEKEEVLKVEKFDRKKIAIGTLLRTEEIQFKADKYELLPSSDKVLKNIVSLLKSNPDIKIEVGGHTNNIPDNKYCDWLSEARAKAVVDFLTKRGISASRLTYKGYGKREPMTTNKTKDGRRKNQRVDIKIIDFDNK